MWEFGTENQLYIPDPCSFLITKHDSKNSVSFNRMSYQESEIFYCKSAFFSNGTSGIKLTQLGEDFSHTEVSQKLNPFKCHP